MKIVVEFKMVKDYLFFVWLMGINPPNIAKKELDFTILMDED